jgi:two-component system response regulator PilR (NtrC family)
VLNVPPLRERPEDLPRLARELLSRVALPATRRIDGFTPRALDRMLQYGWPGNVRELENAVERAVAVSGEGDRMTRLEQLPESITGAPTVEEKAIQIPDEGIDFETQIAGVQKQYLLAALRAAGGVRSRAAELLRMSYRSFRHYSKKYGV